MIGITSNFMSNQTFKNKTTGVVEKKAENNDTLENQEEE